MLLALTVHAAMGFIQPIDSSRGLELSFAASPSQDRKELVVDVTFRWVSDQRMWKLKNTEDVWIMVYNGKTGRAYTKTVSLKGGFLLGEADEVKNRITVSAPAGSVLLVSVEFAYLRCTKFIVLRD